MRLTNALHAVGNDKSAQPCDLMWSRISLHIRLNCHLCTGCACRKSVLSWDEVSQQFQQSVNHFDSLDCPAVVALRHSDDDQLRRYAQIFDQSRSQAPAVMPSDITTISSVDNYNCLILLTVTMCSVLFIESQTSLCKSASV